MARPNRTPSAIVCSWPPSRRPKEISSKCQPQTQRQCGQQRTSGIAPEIAPADLHQKENTCHCQTLRIASVGRKLSSSPCGIERGYQGRCGEPERGLAVGGKILPTVP